jgi:hypothetical protein
MAVEPPRERKSQVVQPTKKIGELPTYIVDRKPFTDYAESWSLWKKVRQLQENERCRVFP